MGYSFNTTAGKTYLLMQYGLVHWNIVDTGTVALKINTVILLIQIESILCVDMDTNTNLIFNFVFAYR